MPLLETPLALAALRSQKQPLLGLDVGDKTIGLALSDALWHVATPHSTVARKTFKVDLKALKDVIATHRVAALVVGLPLNMNGTKGPRVQATEQFVKNFLDHYDIPICFWDERLSTAAVERLMLEGDLSRKKREKRVDQLAASFILQGVLDLLRHQ